MKVKEVHRPEDLGAKERQREVKVEHRCRDCDGSLGWALIDREFILRGGPVALFDQDRHRPRATGHGRGSGAVSAEDELKAVREHFPEDHFAGKRTGNGVWLEDDFVRVACRRHEPPREDLIPFTKALEYEIDRDPHSIIRV